MQAGSPTSGLAHEVRAAPHWRQVDFISDLHLHPEDPVTAEAWRTYLASTEADAVFILGDLFEVWPGDDCLRASADTGTGAGASSSPSPSSDANLDSDRKSPLDSDLESARSRAFARTFARDCAAALRAASQRLALFFLHGNRDFLLGDGFAADTGAQGLADPALLHFGPRKVLLSHGDALCLDDVDYQRFRAQVRDPAWIAALLQRPLAEREALGRQLRAESAARHATQPTYADADTALSRQWLREAGAQVLVHGHTHRPADHDLGEGLVRCVLSDWDTAATPPRAQVLRLDAAGVFQRVDLLTRSAPSA